MIPSLISRIHYAKLNNNNVEIWGDGSVRRQFMYIKDFCKFLFLHQNFDKLKSITNVATTTDYSVTEYNKYVSSVINFKGNFITI